MPEERYTILGGEVRISIPDVPGKDPTKDPDPCPECGAKLRFLEELQQGLCNMCGPGSFKWYEKHPEEDPRLRAMQVQGPPSELPVELRQAIEAQAERAGAGAPIGGGGGSMFGGGPDVPRALDGSPLEPEVVEAIASEAEAALPEPATEPAEATTSDKPAPTARDKRKKK